MRESNAWEPFNGPISRVNLPSFTLIVRKGEVETLIMRPWTWVKKRENIYHLKRNENKKGRKFEPNRNVTETWSFVSDAETRRKRVPSMENWITMFPHGGNLTEISNFPFPSSLQNTETRYFVPCDMCAQVNSLLDNLVPRVFVPYCTCWLSDRRRWVWECPLHWTLWGSSRF